MHEAEYYEMLRADARKWPDHRDYYRHGPVRDTLSVPPVLRVDSDVARYIRLFALPWVPKVDNG